MFVFSRYKKLSDSEEYQQFINRVEEEEAWINEKQQILSGNDYGDSMAAVQVSFFLMSSTCLRVISTMIYIYDFLIALGSPEEARSI